MPNNTPLPNTLQHHPSLFSLPHPHPVDCRHALQRNMQLRMFDPRLDARLRSVCVKEIKVRWRQG